MAQPVRLRSNSYHISRLPQHKYYQYDVVFVPDIEAKERGKRNRLFNHLQVVVSPHLFQPRMVYDGKAIAYSPGRLDLGGNSGVTFNISLGSTTQTSPDSRGSYQIRFNLTSSPPIDPSDVNDLIIRGTHSIRAATATNLIQLIVRQGPNSHNTNNGRAYFTGKDKIALRGSGIELWRGIFQSVRPTIGKMVLTIDTSTAAVYKSGPLIDVALDVLGRGNVRDLRLAKDSRDFKTLEKFFKKLRIKVKTGANGSRSRIKTIRGLEPAAGRYEFTKDGEGNTTVARYFYDAFGLRIDYPDIIGVRLSGKNSSHQDIVPAELCQIETGQLYRQKIPEKFTPDMVKFSTMKPEMRLRKIMDGALAYHRSDYVVESGMILESKALTVEAKILQTPSVGYGRNVQQRVDAGAWNVLGKQFFKPGALNSWAVVNFCPERISPPQCQSIIDALRESCLNLGMAVSPAYGSFPGHGQNVASDLDHVMQGINPALWGDTMIFCLLPSSAAAIRTYIKHWGDVRHGIKTQCLRENKLATAKNQYWNNVALKVNARVGGINSTGLSPTMNAFLKEPFIIMGADVSHPGPGVQKPSVTSLVYSHDTLGTQYAALMNIQNPRTEIIEHLQEFTKTAVDNFGSKHKTAPKHVIMFRDGVSEGEYETVAETEIPAMKAAFKELWALKEIQSDLPLLTFIIVGKRHHSVFFPMTPSEGDRTGNCHPGSVIERDVTHPGRPNFYLQSHAAIQGTCRSSHYIVLEDEIFGIKQHPGRLSDIQNLAYTLCHVYAKATRSVSIPAPVYYADIVCSRGPFHMSPNAHLDFDETLSIASGQTTFDLSVWQQAFMQTNTNGHMDKSMYFL